MTVGMKQPAKQAAQATGMLMIVVATRAMAMILSSLLIVVGASMVVIMFIMVVRGIVIVIMGIIRLASSVVRMRMRALLIGRIGRLIHRSAPIDIPYESY